LKTIKCWLCLGGGRFPLSHYFYIFLVPYYLIMISPYDVLFLSISGCLNHYYLYKMISFVHVIQFSELQISPQFKLLDHQIIWNNTFVWKYNFFQINFIHVYFAHSNCSTFIEIYFVQYIFFNSIFRSTFCLGHWSDFVNILVFCST
jgi:hypothetical protein